MKDKLIEWIRQKLIKIVLPFRKRRMVLLSKFHFSMGFRISFHYLLLMITAGLIVFLPVLWLVYHTDLADQELVFRFNEAVMSIYVRNALWGSCVVYLIICFLVIKSGERGVVRLFEPLRSMSAAADNLTVNNLNSDRLSVEGTKNELKDLAGTINKMLDRIEISYESQKQFVSDASHELRTPIAVIQGYANLLDRWGKEDTEVMEEAIEAIKNESKSMQELVEKLLFLSRHDKKTLKLKKELFNMKEIVEDLAREMHLVIEKRIITIAMLQDVTVYGDKQALKQAVRVFLDNAVKYTEAGDSIRISCQNDNGDCIVTIEDTGIGMTKKDLEHIFERFYRSEHVRNANINGHGLGLSIARLIILSHTGRIKIRSQYTRGSSFIITIPKRLGL